jgi:serine/threonine protein kinase/Tol biopolymer transport system component
LELNASQRAAFLSQACLDDDELRAEVEALLAADEAENSFIDSPALEVAAQIFAHEQGAITGQKLGNYQILSQLGAGGMGEVYLAEDTRLKRKVALKVLPVAFTQNAERVRRFEREAQAASALNHPNILTIHDFGQIDTASGRLHYIVTEFIEGVTLRQRLTRGRLPLPEALSIVKQIAAALDKAHEAGIFHRDIKPENVMLRPDGLVKVLDFGLAKLSVKDEGGRRTDEKDADFQRPPSAFRLPPSQTASGMVMGTPRYMSPEQARGQKLDARSDVFSLGVVFYEMVTGEPAFAGASTAEVFAALLDKEPPPLRQFVPDVPARLQEIISRMLAKDREQRYSSIRAVTTDLAQSGLTSVSGENQPAWHFTGANSNESSGNSRKTGQEEKGTLDASAHPAQSVSGLSVWGTRRLKWIVGALALAGVLGFAGYRWLAASNAFPKQPAGEARFLPLIAEAGRKDHAVISPDESRIAFVWDGGRGAELSPMDVYVKVIGTDGPPLRLTTAPENDAAPCWTPDGKYVTFVRERSGKGEVLRVPASGGPEQKLAETSTSASWSPDGKTLAVTGFPGSAEGHSVLLVNPETGQRTRLTTPQPTTVDYYPSFSPDGKMVAFTRDFGANQVDICVVPADGGPHRQLTFEKNRVSGIAWTGDSREIVFGAIRRGTRGLWRISAQGGTPALVSVNARNPINPDISRQGNKLVWTEFSNDSNLWLYQGAGFAGRDLPGKFGPPVKLPPSSLYEDHCPIFSPDGQKIVFASERTGAAELWMCDAEGKTAARQLTRADSAGSPRWSYDGQWIAFDSIASGDSEIYVISATGDSAWRRLTFEKTSENLPAWSRDGQWIYFRSDRSGRNQIYKMPAAGGEPKQITFNGGYEGFESPDGKLFYYSKGRGVYGIYSVPANGGEEAPVPELKEAGYWRSWTMVNEGIGFTAKVSESEWAIRFFGFTTRRITPLITLTHAPLWWAPGLALSPDGRRLLFAHLEQPYDELMLMENFH